MIANLVSIAIIYGVVGTITFLVVLCTEEDL
jgi:hypothetical protein